MLDSYLQITVSAECAEVCGSVRAIFSERLFVIELKSVV